MRTTKPAAEAKREDPGMRSFLALALLALSWPGNWRSKVGEFRSSMNRVRLDSAKRAWYSRRGP
jgi:hypothetical protein